MSVRERLQSAREAKGWNRDQLDDIAGLGAGHVAKIERGERVNIEGRTFARLATALGVSLEWLISGPEPERVTERKPRARAAKVQRSVRSTRKAS